MVRNQTPVNTLQYGLDDEVLLDRSGLDEFHVDHSVSTASSPRKLRFRQGYGLSLLTRQRGQQFKSKKLRTHAQQGYALEAARIWFTPQHTQKVCVQGATRPACRTKELGRCRQ
jgi:hypothetical protein